MKITCGIQPTGVVTMAMKVLHSSCNMCISDLPNMNALIPWALGIHLRQIPHAHVTTITYPCFSFCLQVVIHASQQQTECNECIHVMNIYYFLPKVFSLYHNLVAV